MRSMSVLVAATVLACGCTARVGVSAQPTRPAAAEDPGHWREAEAGILTNHVQLTFPDRFVKAGEAYFSPDGARIVFQAIETPPPGEPADEFYAMFVADLTRNPSGHVTGIDNVRRISPPGAANTCGWFHPTEPDRVIFATTIRAPTASHPPGYQRSTGRYRWMFPPEMQIVACDLDDADGTAGSLEGVVGDRDAYVAEGAVSPDGRHLVFCSLESNEGDLYVKDLETGRITGVVQAAGYDGGPFFSPEGRRLCYRSDRRGNHLLQLFVADLAFNEAGEIVGIEREYQLTDNPHVNWCPFWHPGGRHLVYSTSEIGHHNYEIFLVEADPGDVQGSTGTIKYGTAKRRVTHAARSDVLPVFNADGTMMMWTSRRGADESAQLWLADFVMDLDGNDAQHEAHNASP